MAEPPRRRSALQFALDITGGQDIVYRVTVYLENLIRQLNAAPGLTTRARLDLILFDGSIAQVATADQFIGMATQSASQQRRPGAALPPLIEQIKRLPFEGGGFHTFLLLTSDLLPGWENDVPKLQQFVASVTGLCCGSRAMPSTAMALSKEPGGTRIVNPLDIIRIQFDSIANWLIENFADKTAPAPAPMPIDPQMDDITARQTIRYDRLPKMMAPNPEPSAPEPTPPPVHAQPPKGAQWRTVEPSDRTDATEHLLAQHIKGTPGWQIIAASRRGKLHAHEGTYRDDAFAIGTYLGWNLIAVADGAGSCRLSRVGARIATETALVGMRQGLDQHWRVVTLNTPELALRAVISGGLRTAHAAVHAEAHQRRIPVRDLSSTLLLLAHHPGNADAPSYVTFGQIGDGLGLIINGDRSMQVIGEADKGFYSGETRFLPNTTEPDWEQHTSVHTLSSAPYMILVMTDGVADDLVPYPRQVPTLINGLATVITERQPERALLDTIGYEKRDSADDRTLAVLYKTTDEKVG